MGDDEAADGRRTGATRARAVRVGATDFTVAVEEEFAILDPETLSLTNRFEELKAAAEGTELEEHLVGELIASEVEVRTGRCDTFAEIAARLPERRAQLTRARRQARASPSAPPGRIRGAPGRSSGSSTRRTTACGTSCCATSSGETTRSASMCTSRSTARTAPCRSPTGCAYLPELLAYSASSPFVENVNTGLHSARTQIFTRFFPRCGVPDAYGDWDTFEDYVGILFETGSIPSTPRCGGASARTSRSRRSRSASPTRSRSRRRRSPSRRSRTALAARIARAIDERRTAAPAAEPRDRGELLARDPLGPLRRAHRPAHAEVRPDASGDRGADRVGAACRRGARRRRVPERSRPRTRPSGRSRASRRAHPRGDLRRAGPPAREPVGG